MVLSARQIARQIDHTVLKPGTTESAVEQACQEAHEWGFAAVCVPPCYVSLAARLLTGSSTLPITVISFPFGYCLTETKVRETEECVQAGAQEVDLVLSAADLKARKTPKLLGEINAVVKAAQGKTVKVIVETGVLTQDEKEYAAELVRDSNAEFIKTSTGFNGDGAHPDDIILFKRILGATKKIKASGGIRTLADALKLLELGADRLGTSSAVAMLKGHHKEGY